MLRNPALLVAWVAVLLLVLVVSAPAAAADSLFVRQDIAPSCNTCHSQELVMNFASGEKLPLKVNPEAFAASVHGGLNCTDCHQAIADYPHSPANADTRRGYEVSQKNVCLGCHTNAYAEMERGLHRVVGDSLICSDCHSAHYMTPAANRESSTTCDNCHSGVGQTYRQSIHGSGADVSDVPGCTACHRAHEFEMRLSRADSVALCINCHSNPDLMGKYGISTNVVSTYLQDYHGKTVALISKQSPASGIDEAICTDCHGVHDIQRVDAAGVSMIQNRMADTCRNCHAGASANFASAWLSHTEPSLQHAPLVFLVNLFYRIMIPFIVVGLLIHIVFDIRRSRRHKGGLHAIN